MLWKLNISTKTFVVYDMANQYDNDVCFVNFKIKKIFLEMTYFFIIKDIVL